MGTSDEPSDGLMHELIGVVRDNTEKTVAVRSDVNRVVSQVYQDIVTIKQQLAAEARERPRRQSELDTSIRKINDRLDGQDKTLDGQDKKLDTLFVQIVRSGNRRFWLIVAVLLVCLFIAARVALSWLGWI